MKRYYPQSVSESDGELLSVKSSREWIKTKFRNPIL